MQPPRLGARASNGTAPSERLDRKPGTAKQIVKAARRFPTFGSTSSAVCGTSASCLGLGDVSLIHLALVR